MSDHIPILGFAAVSREHALKRIRDLEAENESLRQQLASAQRDRESIVEAGNDMAKALEKAEHQLEQLLDALSAWRKTIEGSGAEETAQHHLYAVIDEIRAALAELEKG